MKSILVASDNEEHAEKIKAIIGSDYGQVNISCDQAKYSMDLLKFKPEILFLGFTSINKAQEYLNSVKKMTQYFSKAPFTSVLFFTHEDLYIAIGIKESSAVDACIEFNQKQDGFLAGAIKAAVDNHESIVAAKTSADLAFIAAVQSNSGVVNRSSSAGISQPKSKPVILLVDDDPFIHTLTSKQIDSEHYELMFAHDGEQALSVLANVKPDLIFMDVQMPKMTGVEVTRRIKDMPQTKAVPVVMLTGISDRDVVVSCMAAGAVDFLEKPFNKVKLNSKIESILLK